MKFETNYPFVLVHGMMGFGQDELLNKLVPYWGMLSGALEPCLKALGIKEIYNPSVGKYSSAWDRACELYAQLVGGTVDYGEAHSKKYGHSRYGRTYKKPLFEGFGPDKKVNLFGHSFGSATIRLFASLMAYGSEEEKEATPENELSDLFKGGKADWIFSITAIAGVHEGTTLLYALPRFMDKFEDVTYMLANISGDNLLGKLYESHMEQWGLIGFENGKVVSKPFNRSIQKKIKESHDNVWYDLTLQGAKELNERIQIVPEIYYFSWACCKTTQMFFNPKPRQTPRFSMCPLFFAFSHAIGKYSKNTIDDYPIDEMWLQNDGLVSTVSELAPFNEPHMDLHDCKTSPKKGIWYVCDTIPLDHLGVCGGFLPPTPAPQLQKLYVDHARLICQLKK